MHEPAATYRTIESFSSTTYGSRGGLWPGSVPPSPTLGRFIPAKVVGAGAVHHPAFCLPQTTDGGWATRSVFPRIEKKFVSTDGTVRYLLGFSDGQSVETVWMPEGDGGEAGDGSEDGDAELRDLAFSRQHSALSQGGPIVAISCHPERSESAGGRTESKACPEPAEGDPYIWAILRNFSRSLGPRHHLRLQPGGLRGRMRVLHDRIAGVETQSKCRRDRRADTSGPERPAGRNGARPGKPGLHGPGRAFPELRQLYAGGAAAGRSGRYSGVAHDGFDLGHRAAHRRFRS